MHSDTLNAGGPTEDDFSPIKIPPYIPASSEEIARRQALAERADRIREQLGPLGYSVTDVIRAARDAGLATEVSHEQPPGVSYD